MMARLVSEFLAVFVPGRIRHGFGDRGCNPLRLAIGAWVIETAVTPYCTAGFQLS
jgi:hypothetical protein